MVRTKPPKNGNGHANGSNGNGLTPQQVKFADNYIKTGNATQSYINAGYKGRGNSAESAACQMLRNAKVSRYIQERNAQLSKIRIAGIIEVKEFWSNVLRDADAKMQDRLKASEFIAKTEGAFIDNINVAGKDGGPIQHSHKPDLSKLTDEELKNLERILGRATPKSDVN